MVLKLAREFTQLPLFPDCSPTTIVLQRKLIVKETCPAVGDVITEESPSVNIANDLHATSVKQTGVKKLRLKPGALVIPPVELPSDLQLPATRKSELES